MSISVTTDNYGLAPWTGAVQFFIKSKLGDVSLNKRMVFKTGETVMTCVAEQAAADQCMGAGELYMVKGAMTLGNVSQIVAYDASGNNIQTIVPPQPGDTKNHGARGKYMDLTRDPISNNLVLKLHKANVSTVKAPGAAVTATGTTGAAGPHDFESTLPKYYGITCVNVGSEASVERVLTAARDVLGEDKLLWKIHLLPEHALRVTRVVHVLGAHPGNQRNLQTGRQSTLHSHVFKSPAVLHHHGFKSGKLVAATPGHHDDGIPMVIKVPADVGLEHVAAEVDSMNLRCAETGTRYTLHGELHHDYYMGMM